MKAFGSLSIIAVLGFTASVCASSAPQRLTTWQESIPLIPSANLTETATNAGNTTSNLVVSATPIVASNASVSIVAIPASETVVTIGTFGYSVIAVGAGCANFSVSVSVGATAVTEWRSVDGTAFDKAASSASAVYTTGSAFNVVIDGKSSADTCYYIAHFFATTSSVKAAPLTQFTSPDVQLIAIVDLQSTASESTNFDNFVIAAGLTGESVSQQDVVLVNVTATGYTTAIGMFGFSIASVGANCSSFNVNVTIGGTQVTEWSKQNATYFYEPLIAAASVYTLAQDFIVLVTGKGEPDNCGYIAHFTMTTSPIVLGPLTSLAVSDNSTITATELYKVSLDSEGNDYSNFFTVAAPSEASNATVALVAIPAAASSKVQYSKIGYTILARASEGSNCLVFNVTAKGGANSIAEWSVSTANGTATLVLSAADKLYSAKESLEIAVVPSASEKCAYYTHLIYAITTVVVGAISAPPTGTDTTLIPLSELLAKAQDAAGKAYSNFVFIPGPSVPTKVNVPLMNFAAAFALAKRNLAIDGFTAFGYSILPVGDACSSFKVKVSADSNLISVWTQDVTAAGLLFELTNSTEPVIVKDTFGVEIAHKVSEDTCGYVAHFIYTEYVAPEPETTPTPTPTDGSGGTGGETTTTTGGAGGSGTETDLIDSDGSGASAFATCASIFFSTVAAFFALF